jgi:hypothetical protein
VNRADPPELIHRVNHERVAFWCPGCDRAHGLWVRPHPDAWEFNFDFVKPTFLPSVKATWEDGPNRDPKVCHSYVKEGLIEFLADSTHALAGKTVPLIEWPL